LAVSSTTKFTGTVPAGCVNPPPPPLPSSSSLLQAATDSARKIAPRILSCFIVCSFACVMRAAGSRAEVVTLPDRPG